MLKSDENILLRLEDIKPYEGDLLFKVDGMSADEYIQKLTEEMNKIEFDTIPFDKWDYIVSFSLALLEVAGDFFIGDPQFKHSLANKNGPLVKWMDQFHTKLDHSGQPIDFQGKFDSNGNLVPCGGSADDVLSYGGGAHRGKTFGHDSLPLARLLYGIKENETDSQGVKTGKKVYNGALLVRDILSMSFAIYQISSGTFIDSGMTKGGVYQWVITNVNQKGNPYDSCNVFVAVIKYFTHMIADFCSSTSLPIPGFSLLTHWPDRDVEAFAMKLYKNGMNLRTMALQGIPVAFTEIMMRLYVHFRYKDSQYTESQIDHKRNKLLLISHGITAAVNIGKVIITKNPARLNLLLIARTFHLIWKVTVEELSLTNKAITKEAMGVVKARIETMQTLILLDKTIYETNQYNQLIKNLNASIKECSEDELKKMDDFKNKTNGIKKRIQASRGEKK